MHKKHTSFITRIQNTSIMPFQRWQYYFLDVFFPVETECTFLSRRDHKSDRNEEMTNASLSGYSFCKTQYTKIFNHSKCLQQSFPPKNLDQNDCSSNGNMSHRRYFRSRPHLKEAKSIVFQTVEVGGFSFPPFFCLLSFFNVLISCFGPKPFMLLEFGLAY